MPGSVPQGKQEIKEFIEAQKDIKTVLDIGAGEGTYPKLLGNKYQYLAVEIFEPYVEKFKLRELYDIIIVGNVAEVPLPKTDIIIFGDVLEHLKKPIAKKVLKKALKEYKHVIVSIPIGKNKAKIHYDNIHELHLSKWTMAEIEKLADWKLVKFAGKNSMGIFCI